MLLRAISLTLLFDQFQCPCGRHEGALNAKDLKWALPQRLPEGRANGNRFRRSVQGWALCSEAPRLPKGYRVPAHTTPTTEIPLTVLAGNVSHR